MGSTGIEGVLQQIAINSAAGIGSIEQVTRLSVLNVSAGSLGINQPGHYSIDQFAAAAAVPYSTIRPRSSRRRCSPPPTGGPRPAPHRFQDLRQDGFPGICRTGRSELLATSEHARKQRVETRDVLTPAGKLETAVVA